MLFSSCFILRKKLWIVSNCNLVLKNSSLCKIFLKLRETQTRPKSSKRSQSLNEDISRITFRSVSRCLERVHSGTNIKSSVQFCRWETVICDGFCLISSWNLFEWRTCLWCRIDGRAVSITTAWTEAAAEGDGQRREGRRQEQHDVSHPSGCDPEESPALQRPHAQHRLRARAEHQSCHGEDEEGV